MSLKWPPPPAGSGNLDKVTRQDKVTPLLYSADHCQHDFTSLRQKAGLRCLSPTSWQTKTDIAMGSNRPKKDIHRLPASPTCFAAA